MKIPQHTLEAILFGIAAILCTGGCASTNPLFKEWDWSTGMTHSAEEEKEFSDRLDAQWRKSINEQQAKREATYKTWPSLRIAYDEPGDEQHVNFRTNTGKNAGSAKINR